MPSESTLKNIQFYSTLVTIMSVAVGIFISVGNYTRAKNKEAEAAKITAAKPFLEARQKYYLDALQQASVLATPEVHDSLETAAAKKRFMELYWGELSLVEDKQVESAMIAIYKELQAGNIDNVKNLSYDLSHAMRNSMVDSWGTDVSTVGSVNE